ncbi:uncharacterized protein LOC142143286 [Mixophyes fleayi]|uniref:uncharacterized protein LOC142143286 n=1 Tax=Mixophyes fleayi TaxID=3061075 RepID=UPI003F4E0FC6
MSLIFLKKMEENFLFLNSLGHYTDIPESSVKPESVDKPDICGSQRKRQCEVIEDTNTGYDLFQLGQSESSSGIRMKIEPDERPCRWDPKLNGERDVQQDTDTGYDIYQSGLSNSSLNIIVKNEPDEECRIWRPNLNGDNLTQRPLDADEPHTEEFTQSQQQAERERQRNVRFSEEENDVLINSIMPHYEKLFGRLAARHSTAVKNALWREIVSAVNAISAYPRSVQNCKKRYADIKRKVKDKLSKIAKHKRSNGGGVPLNISFWPYERVMEKMISADIVAGVPGATDSGRMTDRYSLGQSEHDLSDLHELVDEDEAGNVEGEEYQMTTHDDTNDQEEYLEDTIPETEEGRLAVQEDTFRENRPEVPLPCLPQEQTSNGRQQTIRDHTTLIYAEQSHFRRTMSQKLNLLNSNVKALNKNVKAFQKSFDQSIASLSLTLQQQNIIFEKLSSNLLLIAEQQQQHNKQCMSGMQQMFHVLGAHRGSPSPTPSESPSDSSPVPTLQVEARKGPQTHWRTIRRRSKTQNPPEQTPKKRRH